LLSIIANVSRAPRIDWRFWVLALALVAAATAATGAPYAGEPLAQALLDLQARGLKIIFTSSLVTPAMTVVAEPTASEPRRILDELLAPHGLAAQDGPNGTVVVVRAPASAAAPSEPAIEGRPSAVFEEELLVVPSRVSLLRDEPTAPLSLSRAEILALPHLGDDLFRALSLLPGLAANDISAQFHVRGARRDETEILLDGQEIYDAYHLKDYDGAASTIAPSSLRAADLTTGGFPAQYGDRMSGVLDMTTRTARDGPRFWLGAGALDVQAGGAGDFPDGRGGWLADARRGAIDLVGRLLGYEDPRYWDAFGRLDLEIGARHTVHASYLSSDDALRFQSSVDGETKNFDTAYSTSYAWLTLQSVAGAKLLIETAGSQAKVDRDRRGGEFEDDTRFALADRRDLDVSELRQDWKYDATPEQFLTWGAQFRHFTSDYDYRSAHSFDNPVAQIRHDFGSDLTAFQGAFEDDHRSVYLGDRARLLPQLTLELGLRNDRYGETHEQLASPRLNLAWDGGRAGVVRLAWGRFVQSQRLYELQVEDGETGFSPAERSEHRVLGWETALGGEPANPRLALRLELYQRRVENPRVRFENLFQPVNMFPEVEPDRVRTAPEESRAQGIEVFLRGQPSGRLRWFANYAWSSTEDRIDGRWLPRLYDETHSFKLDVDCRLSPNWRVNLAARYHTGWPTTPLAVETAFDEDGEPEYSPRLGRRNSARLAAYHRLDLRASRRWRLRRSTLDAYLDVQNVYDHRNASGYDYEIDPDTGVLLRSVERGATTLPTLGITLEF
jgi:hypothetical protein